jgi:ADP-ribose pyrophosphatase YjhB (NUDIX family)
MKIKAKLIVYKDNSLLLLKKKGVENRHVLPGGNIKKGEKPKKAALREAFEEGFVVVDAKCVKLFTASINLDHKKCSTTYYYITDRVESFSLNERHKFDSIDWVQASQVLDLLNSVDRAVISRLLTTSNKDIN